MTEDDADEVYCKILEIVDSLVAEHNPLVVAGCMLVQALSIYRTALPEEDYNKIVDGISERRAMVRVFGEKGVLH